MSEPSVASRAIDQALSGDVEGARDALARHLASCVDDVGAWHAAAHVASLAGAFDEAAVALERALALSGDEPRTLRVLARVLERASRRDDARAALERALALAPDDLATLREKAALDVVAGAFDAAVACATRARALAPLDARLAYTHGLALEGRRDLAAAIAAFRDSVRLDPSFADARHTLADALASVGELAEAIDVLDAWLRVERRDERAAANREVLAGALEAMTRARLLGRPLRVVEASEVVGRARLVQKESLALGDARRLVRFGAPLAELHVALDRDEHATSFFLVFPRPERAAREPGDEFRIGVVADGAAGPSPSLATAMSLTLLREALGVPLTQASALYARLVGGEANVAWGGARARFATVDPSPFGARPAHGLLVDEG